MNPEELKYPTGKYVKPSHVSDEELQGHINVISRFAQQIIDETESLNEEELLLTYRPGGWNIKQVIHHCADSHMNAFIRYKLALTEENPTVKPYKEALWAELTDVLKTDIRSSLYILEGLHNRWTALLKSMQPADFERTYYHPEKHADVPLWEVTALYAWHCKHHLAHIQQAKKYGNNFGEE